MSNFVREEFGQTKEGIIVDKYTLRNSRGVSISIITFGATLYEVNVQDRKGNFCNINLNFETVLQYEEKENPYFGATIGRYGNRIENAHFKLGDKEYNLPKNNGNHCLHGGLKGFDKHVWTDPVVKQTDTAVSLELIHLSPDGDQGFPGNLKCKVKYTLNENNELIIELTAESDQTTVVNLTNHAYWNLSGTPGTILNHELTLNADHYLPVNGELIPTGDLASVKGTPFDFTVAHEIGERIGSVEGGYDHCFPVNKSENELKLMARLYSPISGIQMDIHSTQPCVQLYTGNFLNNLPGRKGIIYNKHYALCLECQGYNNSLNSATFGTHHLLNAGRVYSHKIVHSFSSLSKL